VKTVPAGFIKKAFFNFWVLSINTQKIVKNSNFWWNISIKIKNSGSFLRYFIFHFNFFFH